MSIYSSPAYALGAVETSSKHEATAAVKSMRRSLRGWLKIRNEMNKYVAGTRKAPALFRAAKPLPPAIVGATLQSERYQVEQELGDLLYALLTEMGYSVPQPDVATDPDATVKLAQIVVNGKTPDEVNGQQGQGIVWFVLAIPIAGVVIIMSQYLKSKADVAKEQEKTRCIESGACTDSGFWLKWGAIAVASWVVWDKFGLRESVIKKKRKA